ncbi:MAG: hypothetical protein R3E01_15155 [Pirellulaceae bacterium]|nr:hypothetical protein [Planctomycetales bacterium]
MRAHPESRFYDSHTPITTGIKGLDDVLCGGFFYSPSVENRPEPPLVLVRGPAGSGKTSLAMHLAVRQCVDQHVAMVFTLDQVPIKIAHHIRSFQQLSTVRTVIDDRWLMRPATQQWPARSSFLLISDFPLYRLEAQQLQRAGLRKLISSIYRPDFFNKFYEHVRTRITALTNHLAEEDASGKAQGRIKIAIVDGFISTVDGGPKLQPQKVQRALIAALGDLFRSHGILPVMLAEDGPAMEWYEYVSDVVIQLSPPQADELIPLRRVQVRKARCQPILPGSHVIRISSGAGVVVYPSPGELMRFRSGISCDFGDDATGMPPRRPGEADRNEAVLWCHPCDSAPGGKYEGFNDFFRGVRQGSATLVIGQDQTKKNVTGVSFISRLCPPQPANSEQLSANPNNKLLDDSMADNTVAGTAIYVFGGTSPRKAHDVVRMYSGGDNLNVCDVAMARPETEVFPAIIAVESQRLHETINEFFRRVSDVVDECRRRGRPVQRALVCDLAYMPAPEKVAQLLREFFSRNNISSIFVYTMRDQQTDEFREYFDNVVQSARLTLPGQYQQAIGYQIRKLRGSSPTSSDYWQLSTVPADNTFARFKLSQESFADLRLSSDNCLSYFPIKIALYSPDECAKRFWSEQATAEFGILDGEAFFSDYDPHIAFFTRDQAESLFEGILKLPADPHLESTQVVNCDSYWSEALTSKLERLDDVFESLGEGTLANLRSQIDETALSKTNREFLIPHHVNFGVYTARLDLIAKALLPPESLDQLPQIEPQPTDDDHEIQHRKQAWMSLLNNPQIRPTWSQLQMIATKCPVQTENAPGFTLSSHGGDESLICFFLEVVWTLLFLASENPDHAHPPNVKSGREARFCTDLVINATTKLFVHLRQMRALPIDAGYHTKSTPEGAKKTYESRCDQGVFQRHWLVTYWQAQARVEDAGGDLRPIAHPILELDHPDLATLPTVSICGDWSLGIVKGSPNPQRAAWVIQSLTGPIAQSQLQVNRIGGSVLKRMADVGPLAELRDVYQQSKPRWSIKNYHRLRVYLAERLRSLLARSSLHRAFHLPDFGDDAEIRSAIEHTFASLDDEVGAGS